MAQLAGVLSQLPPGSVGITGSWLLGLETRESDIDLVIYGRRWEEARKLVARSTGEGVLEPVDEEETRNLADWLRGSTARNSRSIWT